MLFTRSLTLVCLIAICFVPAFSQQFDSNFGVQLKGIGKVLSVDEAPNGDVLAVGEFDFHNNAVSGRVLRLDANGNFVSGFNKVYTNESVKKIKALSDGKMLIQGLFTKVNGNPANHLARLNADGSFDPTFSAPSDNTIWNFDLQANGKIIVVDYPWGKVYRLNTNGSIDNTFTSINFVQHQLLPVHHLQVDSQDRVLIGNWKQVLRLTSEGLLDNTFNSSTLVHDGSIFTLTIQPNDKVLLGGSFSEFAGTVRRGLIRIEENGSVDVTLNGTPDQSQTYAIDVTSDGRILTGGNNAIYSFSATGNSKQVVAMLPYGNIYALKQTHDNNIIVGGWFQDIGGQEQSMLAKLKSDFSCSSQFSPVIFNTTVAGRDIIAIAPNGEILLGGWDQNFINAGNIKKPLIRITKQGAIDETFQPELESNSMINTLEVQQNNQILVSGILNFNGTFRTFARLKSDGTFDPSFNSGGNGTGNMLEKIRFNGSDIFIAGSFSKYNNTPSTSFAILTKDGQIKKTCQVFGEATSIRSFDFQSDGKIVVIGQLQMSDGTLKGMVRLNRDLTLDETFTPKNTGNYFAIKIDRENRIYVGGSWLPLINPPDILVRLNRDGELDPNFKNAQYITYITPMEISNIKEVSLIDILPSNQIVVGGYFSHYKGVEANGLIIFDKEDSDKFSVPTETLGPTTLVKHLLYHGSSIYAGGRLSFENGKKILSLSKIKLNAQSFINPGTPSNAKINDQTPELTTLDWVDGTDAEDGYEIERYSETDKAYMPVAVTPSNWTSFLDNANSDSELRYRIRSYNEKNKSGYKYINQQMTDFFAPFSPTELVVTENEQGVYLSWKDDSDNENGFVIERKVNDQPDFIKYLDVNADITNFIDDDIQPGNKYYYRVASFNNVGTSSYIEGSIIINANIVTDLEKTSESDFVAWPNPTTSYINISGHGTIQGIGVINYIGQPMALNFTQSESNVYRIDVSTIPNGLYWLTLSTTEGIKRLKVVKH